MVILVTQLLFLQLKFEVTQVDEMAMMLKDWFYQGLELNWDVLLDKEAGKINYKL